jgi:hypothetical protein
MSHHSTITIHVAHAPVDGARDPSMPAPPHPEDFAKRFVHDLTAAGHQVEHAAVTHGPRSELHHNL